MKKQQFHWKDFVVKKRSGTIEYSMERTEGKWDEIVWNKEGRMKTNTKTASNRIDFIMCTCRLLKESEKSEKNWKIGRYSMQNYTNRHAAKSQEFPFSRILHFSPIYTKSRTFHPCFTLVHLVFDLYTFYISLPIKMSSEAAVEVQIEKVLSIWLGSFIV